jgi:hypothetical protein
MTYWATLWYAGTVVLTMGAEGQKLNECELMGKTMMEDIRASYEDPAKQQELRDSIFPKNRFTVTCEPKRLPTNEKYLQ